MALVELNIYQRQTSGKNANRRTRAAGRIPAVLYGRDRETDKVEVDTSEFTKAIALMGGRSVIFALKQEDKSEDAIALLREVQRNPVSDTILHIDLFEIPRGKPITAPVKIELEGESLAIKRGDANLTQVLNNVEVSCLPRELPDEIKIDITDLGLGDKIYVKDLQISAGEIVADPETLVLLLKAPTIFVEEEPEVAEEVAEGEGEEAADAAATADEGKGDSESDKTDTKGK